MSNLPNPNGNLLTQPIGVYHYFWPSNGGIPLVAGGVAKSLISGAMGAYVWTPAGIANLVSNLSGQMRGSDIANDSSVSGTSVSAALDTLAAQLAAMPPASVLNYAGGGVWNHIANGVQQSIDLNAAFGELSPVGVTNLMAQLDFSQLDTGQKTALLNAINFSMLTSNQTAQIATAIANDPGAMAALMASIGSDSLSIQNGVVTHKALDGSSQSWDIGDRIADNGNGSYTVTPADGSQFTINANGVNIDALPDNSTWDAGDTLVKENAAGTEQEADADAYIADVLTNGTLATVARKEGVVLTVNGENPDAAGDIDLCAAIPTRTPDFSSQENIFCDSSGIGKYQAPGNIYEFPICAVNGSAEPAGLPVSEKTYWATGNGTKILMAKAGDGKFYSVNQINAETVGWQHGLVFNGRADDSCNSNFQTQNLKRMVDEPAPNGAAAYWRARDGAANPYDNRFEVPDAPITFSSANSYKVTFDLRWKNTDGTSNPFGHMYGYLRGLSRDAEPMGRVQFYPSPFGKDYLDYLETGNVTPEGVATCGPDIVLTQDLNPGDTVLKLNDVSFWDGVKTSWVWRYLRFCNDTDSSGAPYYSYSRNQPKSTNGQGQFLDTSIDTTSNEITLIHPWDGHPVPAGTRVANSVNGGSNYYAISEAAGNHQPEGQWNQYVMNFPALGFQPFPQESAKVKIGLILNYAGGVAENFTYDFANFYMEKV